MDLRQFLSNARRCPDRLTFIQQTGRLFYAFDWLRAGSGITLDRQPDGVEIGVDHAALAALGPNDKVAASSGDTAGYLDAKVANSVSVAGDRLQLTNDSASPAADAFYGSDGASARGYHGFTEIDVVTDVGLDDAGVPLLQTRSVFVWSPGDPSGYGDPSEVVATPAFTPDGGSHVGSVDVTITCATAGAAIYYTTDGSVPTAASTLYSGPVTLTADGSVLKARAYKAGLTPSNVKSATYEIVADDVPDEFSGLILWLRADVDAYTDAGSTLATDGQTVQAWHDHSGIGNHATQASGGNRPTWVESALNGLPGVAFTGGTDVLACAGAVILAGPLTVFFVVNGSAVQFGNSAGSTSQRGTHATDGGVTQEKGTGGSHNWSVSPTGSPLVQAVTWDGTTGANAVKLYEDGTQTATDTAATASPGTPSHSLDIGDYGGGPNGYNGGGTLHEIIVYDAELDATDVATITDYLTTKWGA